jgi:hypothetical protein
MKERDRIVVSGLVALMLLLWLGFLVHRSPRFPGSLWGGVLGVSSAALMMVPLAYSVIKRIGPLKRAITHAVSMRTLLGWHIYAGILGPILALLHTGHKFDSPLGVALTAMMLIVVLSGFTGRYLLSQISEEIREKKNLQAALLQRYQDTAAEIGRRSELASAFATLSQPIQWLRSYLLVPLYGVPAASANLYVRAVDLAESISDLQYAIQMDDFFKSWFTRWLKLHIALSAVLYVLLGLHVWAELHFGIRWFKA